jgi:hypothetical protein
MSHVIVELRNNARQTSIFIVNINQEISSGLFFNPEDTEAPWSSDMSFEFEPTTGHYNAEDRTLNNLHRHCCKNLTPQYMRPSWNIFKMVRNTPKNRFTFFCTDTRKKLFLS